MNHISALDVIKKRIQKLYETNPNIHINLSLTSPRLHLQNVSVVIKGVYPHIFQIEERESGSPKCHTVQYSDVMTNQVEILELNTTA